MINKSNEKYRDAGLALVQKIPTPITPITIDKKSSQIPIAYFDQKSTVDYIGAVQGVPVCFDAKESASETFSLQNIHEHQVQFMLDFKKQKGIAFFLINYSKRDIYYYLSIDALMPFWERAKNGGRKSFRFDELDTEWILPKRRDLFVPYLDMVDKYLNIINA